MSGTGASTGRSSLVYYSLSADTTTVPTDFVRLGATRGVEYGAEYDTVDTTANNAAGNNFTKTNLVTYKSENVSLNGVSRQEEVENQKALRLHIQTPPSASNFQPCGWLRIVKPDGSGTETYSVPVIFTSWKYSEPHDAETTWSMEALSNGQSDTVFA